MTSNGVPIPLPRTRKPPLPVLLRAPERVVLPPRPRLHGGWLLAVLVLIVVLVGWLS